MNFFKTVVTTTKKAVKKASHTVKKNKGTICIVAGIAGVVAGTVIAIKVGAKAEEELAEPKKDLEEAVAKRDEVNNIAICDENGNVRVPVFTMRDYRINVLKKLGVYIFKLLKLTLPLIAVMVLSITSIGYAYNLIRVDKAKITAAFAGMAEAYEVYRSKVIDEFGEETDRQIRAGIKNIDISEPILNAKGEPKVDKNGEVKCKTVSHEVIENFIDVDPRTILFDEQTAPHSFNCDYDDVVRHDSNLTHVLLVEDSANKIIKSRYAEGLGAYPGKISVNEVRKMIGVKPIDCGDFIGWIFDPSDSRYAHAGEKIVDFGLQNPNSEHYERNLAFLDGNEDAILLRLNYDGIIFDKGTLRTKTGVEIMRRLTDET